MTGKNHGIDRALNAALLPAGFMAATAQAWCFETCWPGCAAGYPQDREENPSFGNCFVTTLAAWASRGFQDEIVPSKIDETAWHFRLRINGVQVDPTWQQCEQDAQFRELTCRTPAERGEYRKVVIGSVWEDDSLPRRLQLLIDRMRDLGGYDVGYDAAEIIGRLKQYFSFVREPGYIGPATVIPKISLS